MADNNSSVVGIVAVIAIVVLVGGFLYYIFANRAPAGPAETNVQVETPAPDVSAPDVSAPKGNGE